MTEDLVMENEKLKSEKSNLNTILSRTVFNKTVLENDRLIHQQELILQALRASHGSRKLAAMALGVSPRTLRYKLSKMRDQGVIIPRACRMASA
jgi:DNA-binding NtrC family response regulator